MKRHRVAVTLGSAFGLFYVAVVAVPFIAAQGIGEVAHRTLIYNYPLSWLLLKLGALETVIDSPTWIRVGFFSIFGFLMYAATGFALGWIWDRIFGSRTADEKWVTH